MTIFPFLVCIYNCYAEHTVALSAPKLRWQVKSSSFLKNIKSKLIKIFACKRGVNTRLDEWHINVAAINIGLFLTKNTKYKLHCRQIMLKWSFYLTSMNSIPLFFYERLTLKRMNMTSVLGKTAANNPQNCTWYQKLVQNIKVQFIKSGRVLDSSVEINKR